MPTSKSNSSNVKCTVCGKKGTSPVCQKCKDKPKDGGGWMDKWEKDQEDKEGGCHKSAADATLSPEEAIKQLSARISKISEGIAQGTIPAAKMPVATSTLQQLITKMSTLSQHGKPTVASISLKNPALQARLARVAKVIAMLREAGPEEEIRKHEQLEQMHSRLVSTMAQAALDVLVKSDGAANLRREYIWKALMNSPEVMQAVRKIKA